MSGFGLGDFVRDCVLTVYGDDAKILAEGRVVIPPLPEKSVLERLYREHLDGKPLRYAVAREGRVVHALYLAEDLIPKAAHRFSGRKGRVGRWATTSMILGQALIGRAFAGPELFFRQIDLGPDESWLAPILMGFAQDAEIETFPFPSGERVYHWELRGEHFYYISRGARWTLYGAGNTPADRLEALAKKIDAQSASDLLWEVGGIPIAKPKSKASLQGL